MEKEIMKQSLRNELLTKLSSFGIVEVLSEGKSFVFMMTGKGFEDMKTLLSIGNLVSDYAEKNRLSSY